MIIRSHRRLLQRKQIVVFKLRDAVKVQNLVLQLNLCLFECKGYRVGVTRINVDPGQHFFSDHGLRACHLRVKANLIAFQNEILSFEEFIYLSSFFTKVFIVAGDKPSNDGLGLI